MRYKQTPEQQAYRDSLLPKKSAGKAPGHVVHSGCFKKKNRLPYRAIEELRERLRNAGKPVRSSADQMSDEDWRLLRASYTNSFTRSSEYKEIFDLMKSKGIAYPNTIIYRIFCEAFFTAASYYEAPDKQHF